MCVVAPRVIIGRQPIYDRDLNVYAYELLFRAGRSNTSGVTAENADMATSRVINHAFMELGIERVIGEHIGFINLTRNFLLSDDPIPFTQEKIVLEVLEDIEIDQSLLDAVKKLVYQGYTLALDDFIYNDKLKPLVKMAKIIKVDILDVDEEKLTRHVHELKHYPVRLLAEKIETREQFNLCMQLGFELFQGYYFCRPTIIEDKPVPENHFKLFQIIERLQDPNVEFSEIERLILQEVGLSYKLLRLLNSAAIGLRRKIDSIQQGLIILGLKAIKTWTTLIALNAIESVPAELMTHALIRAKMCEKLAPNYGFSDETGFLTGMFSNIDVMIGMPMEHLMISLPLNGELKLALTHRGGPLGKLLDMVIAYEQGQWDVIDTQDISLESLSDIYVEATEWTIQTKTVL
ncbi:HDOD domain-containing protein [Methylophaga sp. SB9B]|uniref:EAL and HDOD domain-containing protein n=1 Tax=Methylophaga sp. SB9B TaxID=2570356 RepID=UPI0010A75E61|nr:HDOD domain-containing protein [Methylophaga sp. SB9B]THK42517.1 HDOD domain-containing protein [Methylophaga sp. SB9B]